MKPMCVTQFLLGSLLAMGSAGQLLANFFLVLRNRPGTFAKATSVQSPYFLSGE